MVLQQTARSQETAENIFFLAALGRSQPCPTPISGLPGSKTVRVTLLFKPPVCGILREQS